MKTMALDIGDKWTGTALSDPLGILARPYQTVATPELSSFLSIVITKEQISNIVVGLPTTLKGTISDQTQKIIDFSKNLEQEFPTITWTLWDERFTSKQANSIKHAKTRDEKLRSHSIAAALILSTYLDYKRMQSAEPDSY
jgi:putative holliday junction resolvase